MTLFVLGCHQLDGHNMAMPKMRNKANNQANRVGFKFQLYLASQERPRGATDNASAYGAEDCRFESCRGRYLCLYLK